MKGVPNMNQVSFTFIFKSGKVSKVTSIMTKEELERLNTLLAKMEGIISLNVKNKSGVVVRLDDCSAIEYSVVSQN